MLCKIGICAANLILTCACQELESRLAAVCEQAKKLAALHAEKSELEQRAADFSADLAKSTADLSELSRAKAAADTQLSECKQALEHAQLSIQGHQEHLASLQASLAAATTADEGKAAEVQDLQEQISSLTADRSADKDNAAEAQRLQEQIVSLEASLAAPEADAGEHAMAATAEISGLQSTISHLQAATEIAAATSGAELARLQVRPLYVQKSPSFGSVHGYSLPCNVTSAVCFV